MSAEKLSNTKTDLLDNRMGRIRDWSEMSHIIDSDINPHDVRFVRVYFRSQLLVADGKLVKAKRLFRRLSKWTDFDEFEKRNENVLAKIDIAVRGETRR